MSPVGNLLTDTRIAARLQKRPYNFKLSERQLRRKVKSAINWVESSLDPFMQIQSRKLRREKALEHLRAELVHHNKREAN